MVAYVRAAVSPGNGKISLVEKQPKLRKVSYQENLSSHLQRNLLLHLTTRNPLLVNSLKMEKSGNLVVLFSSKSTDHIIGKISNKKAPQPRYFGEDDFSDFPSQYTEDIR